MSNCGAGAATRNCRCNARRGFISNAWRFLKRSSSISRRKTNSRRARGWLKAVKDEGMKSGREEKEAESRERGGGGDGRRKFEALCEAGGMFRLSSTKS